MPFYGTVTDADAYHAARGNDAWAGYDETQKEAALTRATDYLDQMFRYMRKSGQWVCMFSGRRSDADVQQREFPRDDIVVYDGTALPDDSTPVGIRQACYEAALFEAATPGGLTPVYTPTGTKGAITQETVGPITTKYDGITSAVPGFEQRPPNMPILFAVERLVAPFLRPVAMSGCGVRVV